MIPRKLMAVAIAVAITALVSGCASAPPPSTVTDIKYIAVKADKDSFRIAPAPKPVQKEDLVGKDKNGMLMVLNEKIIDLYGYIGNLQSQILSIQEEQNTVADRIEKGNKK